MMIFHGVDQTGMGGIAGERMRINRDHVNFQSIE